MRLSVGVRTIATIAVAAAASACGESTTGPLVDPSSLAASLASVDSVFASPLVRSVGILSYGVPLPQPAAGAPLIPDSLLGKTFVWSCAAQAFGVGADMGAPATGVRFALYEIAPNGGIVCPATRIGQLDLFDVSTTGLRAIHAVATSAGGSEPLVDYTLEHATTDQLRSLHASDSVSDGQHRVSFLQTDREGSGPNSVISTVALDDSAADVHELLQDSGEMGVDTHADDLDLTVHHGPLAVELKGTTDWANTLVSWDETMTVNNVPFAKVSGNWVPQGSQPTITPLSSMLFFTSDERQLVLDVVAAPDTISLELYYLLGAPTRLVLSGP